jgi:hypothetical protein
MTVINLKEEHYLGHGHQRICYIHPDDDTKVIKVVTKKRKIPNFKSQNLIEFLSYKLAEDTVTDFSFMPKCYGWVETSEGEGLVFDRVRNYDGSPVLTLHHAVKERQITWEEAVPLVEELNDYLKKNNILFVDAVISNVLLQKVEEGRYKLVVIDGLGARKLTMKYAIQNSLRPYKVYKMYKQRLRLLKNLKHVVALAKAADK